MFMSIDDLRETCSLVIEVIDERDELLKENLKLRKELKEAREWQNHMYQQSINTTATILNTLIERSES